MSAPNTDAPVIPSAPDDALDAFGEAIMPGIVDAAHALYMRGYGAGFLAGLDAAEAVMARLRGAP